MTTNCTTEIKRAVTMQQVCEMYGIEINRQNKALCPFHNDGHASMHIYGGDRGYYCFSCGANGDVITFVQKYFNLTFPAALDKLNADFCLGLPIGEKLTPEEQKRSSIACAVRNRSVIADRVANKRLLDRYNAALDRFTALDIKCRDGALKCETDGIFTDEYIEAMSQIDQAKAELDEAETRLWEHEKRNHDNSRVHG